MALDVAGTLFQYRMEAAWSMLESGAAVAGSDEDMVDKLG